jgi:hypothetical protein
MSADSIFQGNDGLDELIVVEKLCQLLTLMCLLNCMHKPSFAERPHFQAVALDEGNTSPVRRHFGKILASYVN